MTSKERIISTILHKETDQVGNSFNDPGVSDFFRVSSCRLIETEKIKKYSEWGNYEELKELSGFSGEVRYDAFGNIYGRFNELTKGECVKGALSDWDDFENFELPEIDLSYYSDEFKEKCKNTDKFVVAGSSFAVFSALRDTRLMTNALMDIVLETENVELFLQKILERNLELIDNLKDCHVNALMFWDDWGTQDRTFISPNSFRELFKPIYKAIADRLHSYGMYLIVHSCGYNYAFMDDFIDAGIDILQFDQLGIYGYKHMADTFGGKVTFWSPLDIQKTLPTGNKELIESEAYKMIDSFNGKGSLIIADYASYEDIAVKDEWVNWAKKVFADYQKSKK